jgi:hypothetical protein
LFFGHADLVVRLTAQLRLALGIGVFDLCLRLLLPKFVLPLRF